MVSAGELVYGKRRALPAHPVHAHPSSRSSHKPSDVVRPTETRCRFCAGRMSSYEVGEAVAISKQAGRPGRAPLGQPVYASIAFWHNHTVRA